MADAVDKQVHDYLDGRLGDAERVAFEQRLSRDRELARRVASYREIGRALREDDVALSAGFYTRARARFEAGRRPPRRLGWRLLSWEAAGVVAATALAAVVFLPVLHQRDESLTAPPAAPRTAVPESTPAERQSQGLRHERAAPLAKPERETQVETEAADEDSLRSASEDTGGFAPVPAAAEKKETTAAPGSPSPSGGTATSSTSDAAAMRDAQAAPPESRRSESGIARDDRAKAGEPAQEENRRSAEPPPPARPAPAPRRQGVLGQESVNEQEGRGAALSGVSPERPPVPLPAGLVGPGEIRTVVDSNEWASISRTIVDGGGPALRPWTPGLRLVLVGPRRSPLSCNGLEVVSGPDGYTLLPAAPGPDRPTAAGGCVLVLPDDGLPISFREPEARGD